MTGTHWLFRLVPLGALGLLAWSVRARNIAEDSSQQTVLSIIPVVVFVGLSVAVLVIAWRAARRGSLEPGERRLVVATAALSAFWWVVRALDILFEDHSAAFTGVHLVLAGAIVAASAWAVVGLRRRRSLAST